MPDSDVHVYEHDFDDVDQPPTGYPAELEHDFKHDGGRYEHLGTYDLLDHAGLRSALHHGYGHARLIEPRTVTVIERRWAVVHRRAR